jgi:protein gp37
MADVFEARPDLEPWRERLWSLIEATPQLDWLLLTKRPDNVAAKVPWRSVWPPNVWLGTTIETQEWAEKRLSDFLKLPAALHFLSCEPLLGHLDLSPWLPGLNWVIAGGESGPRARPMIPSWPRRLRDQCLEAGVAFHFKQWGEWRPLVGSTSNPRRTIRIRDGNLETTLGKFGKKSAGRELDGKIWDEIPIPRQTDS